MVNELIYPSPTLRRRYFKRYKAGNGRPHETISLFLQFKVRAWWKLLNFSSTCFFLYSKYKFFTVWDDITGLNCFKFEIMNHAYFSPIKRDYFAPSLKLKIKSWYDWKWSKTKIGSKNFSQIRMVDMDFFNFKMEDKENFKMEGKNCLDRWQIRFSDQWIILRNLWYLMSHFRCSLRFLSTLSLNGQYGSYQIHNENGKVKDFDPWPKIEYGPIEPLGSALSSTLSPRSELTSFASLMQLIFSANFFVR